MRYARGEESLGQSSQSDTRSPLAFKAEAILGRNLLFPSGNNPSQTLQKKSKQAVISVKMSSSMPQFLYPKMIGRLLIPADAASKPFFPLAVILTLSTKEDCLRR
jgi:hypothetical protein